MSKQAFFKQRDFSLLILVSWKKLGEELTGVVIEA